MGWSNAEWAQRHIAKHSVTLEEAWEVFFAAKIRLRARDQLNFPPYFRYWTIGVTNAGRKHLVVWEKHREELNLITAFEPDQQKENFYEREKKGQKAGG